MKVVRKYVNVLKISLIEYHLGDNRYDKTKGNDPTAFKDILNSDLSVEEIFKKLNQLSMSKGMVNTWDYSYLGKFISTVEDDINKKIIAVLSSHDIPSIEIQLDIQFSDGHTNRYTIWDNLKELKQEVLETIKKREQHCFNNQIIKVKESYEKTIMV